VPMATQSATLRGHMREVSLVADMEDIARTMQEIAATRDIPTPSSSPAPAAPVPPAPAVSVAAAAAAVGGTSSTGTTSLQEYRKMSTEAKAEETKKRLSNFYGALHTHVLAHVFTFDVFVPPSKEKDKSRKRALQVDLAAGTITRFTKLRRKRKELWTFANLLNAVRNDFDPELVLLRMRDGSDVTLRFAGQVERERFYQLCWLGQCNTLATGSAAAMPATSENISVFVGTWNMADRAPKQPPELWLRPGAYDVCAVCAQECTSDALFQRLTGHLEINGAYILLERAAIYYVKLAVYVHRRHLAKIRNVERATESTGMLGGVVGNKGAVAIAFQLAETSFCFVGCHLEAGEEERDLASRNGQYATIVRGLHMGAPRCDILNQFDHVVWCGDMNYRLDGIAGEQAVSLVKSRNYARLLEHDQLGMARATGEVFLGFAEGQITFPPTYKLVQTDSGTRVYDKHRVPAWCDRVLWKSLPGAAPLRQVEYGCSDILTSSDHRPVFSIFHTSILFPGDPTRTAPLSISFRGATVARDLPPREGNDAGSAMPDPVLVFKAPFLNPRRTLHSRVKRGTRNPEWAEGEIRDIPTCLCDPAFLAKQHITVLLLHLDATTQEMLGQCVIPLGPLSQNGVRFEAQITRNGKAAGFLTGTVFIVPSS